MRKQVGIGVIQGMTQFRQTRAGYIARLLWEITGRRSQWLYNRGFVWEPVVGTVRIMADVP